MKLLTICVTRARPELCEKMIKSFLKTRSFADLFVYIHDKDPKVEEYKKLDKKYSEVEFYFGRHRNYCPAINFVSKKLKPDYYAYQEINDDHVFITEKWDEKLIEPIEKNNGWGISYPRTDIQERDYRLINNSGDPSELPHPKTEKESRKIYQPSAVVMSSKVLKTLGNFYFYRLRHIGGDDYIRLIGFHTNLLFYLRDVKINHLCWHGREQREQDKNDKWIYSNGERNHMKHWMKIWEKKYKDKEINKIKKAIEDER